MKQRKLGQSGLSVSALGLGCMGMSEFYGASDEERSLETLNYAFERGVNFFDTADTYGFGHNEELLKGFLANKRQQVILASKCGIVRKKGEYERRIDTHPDYIVTACDASLQRLGTDYIDLYYLHRYNPDVPIEESVGALSRLIEAGKIRNYGLCEVSQTTLRRAHGTHPVTALQSEYSLWSRDPEQNILAATRELNIGFVAYSPLGRGFLTGKVTNTNELEEGDFRKANPRFLDENLKRNLELLEGVQLLAREHGATPGQVALAWLLARGEDIIPIPGTRRKTYLDENIAACDVHLSAQEQARLDDLFSPNRVQGARYTQEGMKGLNA